MDIYYHTGPDTYQSRDLSDDISVITVLGCGISNIFLGYPGQGPGAVVNMNQKSNSL